MYKEDPDELSPIEKIIKQTEYMYEFTKRSVDHTIFITNLIKKTKFMSKNGIKNHSKPIQGFKSKMKNFNEEKKSSKDDGYLAYIDKDPLKEFHLKRKLLRNFSHRGNLSTLETEEIKNNDVADEKKSFEVIDFLGVEKTIIEEKEENEDSFSDSSESFGKKESLVRVNEKNNKSNSPDLIIKKNMSNINDSKKTKLLKKKNIVKKVISMPNLNGFEESSPELKKKKHNGFSHLASQQYIDIFFYYFESFLDQFLLKRLNRKRLGSTD